ncbi:MAG: cell envelope integrity protein CreD [Fusobacterium perfoetens]|uniref:cell envelope integrity protein CreD n=1 Tax=Fusobacterium perfoetens TaxID=852 RepID=UPI0023F1AA19|nr:cell envelope integrity protein CreD [Fusobacterium perfoetens]MCI6152275.1 cell envelope integrity protein CreD [Fusobacterium perfoetens]MDY3238133.1 cell envelope integrity protein CreD [Fusobacterium perfoetens]
MISLRDNNSLVKKIGFLFILAILLQIPMFFINRIIDERDYSYRNMVEEIGNEWGKKQTIAGAFLIIPYSDKEVSYDDSGKKLEKTIVKDWIVLPDKLNIKVDLKDEVRERGIYKTIVYNGDVTLEGEFPKLKDVLPANMYPYNIGIGLGITDTKSIMKVEKFQVGEEDIYLASGTGLKQWNLSTGISGTIEKNYLEEGKITFSIKLNLRGNGGINILPFGKENHFEVTSPWKAPKFYGILPSTKVIDENGFKAEWDVSSFVRNYKQDFTDGFYSDISEGKIGVDLYEGITHYRQVMRAVKYSMLFIMLSLFVVYIFEVTSKRFTHYIQYGVVGFSLTMFYLVLLSMSEYFSFELAYIIATLMVVIPNSLYIKAVTKNNNYGIGIFVFLSGIYAVLYSILKMEQYALMTGTLLIMIVLYVMMYITRNIETFREE